MDGQPVSEEIAVTHVSIPPAAALTVTATELAVLRVNNWQAFSPLLAADGTILIATSDAHGGVRLPDIRTRSNGVPLIGHKGTVWSMVFSLDGTLLATGGADGVRVWDFPAHRAIGEPLTGRDRYVRSLAFSPDGRLLAAGGSEGTILLWEVLTREIVEEYPPRARTGSPSLAFRLDGTLLSVGLNADEEIMAWEVRTERAICGPFPGKNLFLGPDGTMVATIDSDRLRLWDTRDGHEIGSLPVSSRLISSVQFSLDCRLLATGDDRGEIRLWRLNRYME